MGYYAGGRPGKTEPEIPLQGAKLGSQVLPTESVPCSGNHHWEKVELMGFASLACVLCRHWQLSHWAPPTVTREKEALLGCKSSGLLQTSTLGCLIHGRNVKQFNECFNKKFKYCCWNEFLLWADLWERSQLRIHQFFCPRLYKEAEDGHKWQLREQR